MSKMMELLTAISVHPWAAVLLTLASLILVNEFFCFVVLIVEAVTGRKKNR